MMFTTEKLSPFVVTIYRALAQVIKVTYTLKDKNMRGYFKGTCSSHDIPARLRLHFTGNIEISNNFHSVWLLNKFTKQIGST